MYSRLLICLLAFLLSSPPIDATSFDHKHSLRALDPYIESYYSVNGSTHAEKIKVLANLGYRPLSLSSYGPAHEALYAATWVRERGSTYKMIHGVNQEVFNTWVEKWRHRGYTSTHVTATGTTNEAVFAGVMEQLNIANWSQACGIKDLREYMHTTDQDKKMAVKGFRMYGERRNRRYCVLRHENIGNEHRAFFWEPTLNFPEAYDAKIAKRYWRPAKLFLSDDNIVSPIFTDTSVGNWSSGVRLNSTSLKARIVVEKQRGLFPVDIQGGKFDEEEEKFNVVFTQLLNPKPRRWRAVGDMTKFDENVRARQGLDWIMETFMKKNGVRQAQVAISSEGKVVGERSYTWAEDDRSTVRADDVFLIASVSKMFLYAAITWLVDHGKLSYSTKVYDLLGFKPTVDDRANQITVQHLLDHRGGYDRKHAGDVTFQFAEVALSLPTGGTKPATVRDIIEYMLDRKLDFTPGERTAYSNYGTLLLGYVVSNITEMPYMDFLKENIFGDLDVRLYETAASKHKDDRIVQESSMIGPDPKRPRSRHMVPAVNGGDGALKEECAAAFSLAASASTLAKFVGSHCKSYPIHASSYYRRANTLTYSGHRSRQT
jgi:CubicO group peptidase (beta-lactamase class C family)